MMSFAICMCLSIGVLLIAMGLRAAYVSKNRILPTSYKLTYFILYVCYIVMAISLVEKLMPIATWNDSVKSSVGEAIIVSIMIALAFADIFIMPTVMFNTNHSIRKMSFKAALFGGFTKKEEKEYQKINAREFADKYNLEYSMVVCGDIIESDDYCERIIAKDNKYVRFYPYNDGYTYTPKRQWFGKFIIKGDEWIVRYLMIMDSKKAFSNITNLKEILMQMIELYWDNIDKDVFMDPYEFGLMLEDEPAEGYVGHARLVITADTIKNRKIDVDEKEHARQYYLNRFLDCFMSWNFGAIIEQDVELQVRLNQLNELAILKGIRKPRYNNGELEFNEYIKRYKLKTE